MLRTAFSTGFTFFYWPNDKGYLSQEYRVTAKFQSLKEEILESGFLSAGRWAKLVELKTQKYIKTIRARKMKAHAHGRFGTGQIEHSPVTMQHLEAIILYCDFTKLCTAFSSTFRRLNVFESVESVIARHSEFGNFGKLLVEAVLDFGENRLRNNENGPFFCGLNCILNIGVYAIRLQGPCSTTTEREVALNFAKRDGLILMLKNDSSRGVHQPVLNCAWISNFHEESERLWIAGEAALRIGSITIVKTAKNYQKVMRALYMFDWMIGASTGLDRLRFKEERRDSEVISNIFDLSLNSKGTLAVDPYLKKDCELFLQKKETVRMEMHDIFENTKIMSKLVLYKIVRNRNSTPNGYDNVIRPEWLSMFPVLRNVVIDDNVTSLTGPNPKYEFRLDALLETVKQISSNITITVLDSEKWCEKALTNEISEAYTAAGWSIEYKKVKWSRRSALVVKSQE